MWLCYQGPITVHSVLANELGCCWVLKAHMVKSFLLVRFEAVKQGWGGGDVMLLITLGSGVGV